MILYRQQAHIPNKEGKLPTLPQGRQEEVSRGFLPLDLQEGFGLARRGALGEVEGGWDGWKEG